MGTSIFVVRELKTAIVLAFSVFVGLYVRLFVIKVIITIYIYSNKNSCL